jgi:outer membrane biosynthesis protein TonB
MDRAEATGFGIAAAGHAALLAALTLGFANAVKPPVLSEPMEVSIVEEAALESAAPVPTLEEPAARLAEVEGPVEESVPPPPEPIAEPIPQPKAIEPAPAPVPKPVAKPRPPKPPPPKAVAKPAPAKKALPKAAAPAKAKQAPAKTATAPKSSGRLSGILAGISDRDSASKSTQAPGKVASAAVRASLAGEVRRQLKPHWKAPTGADVEQLRTELSISLAPNGRVTNVEVLRTTGQTESNRPQVKLHQEQAVKAARLASPFRLPPEYYDAWKLLSPIGFDKRLSQ